MDFGSCRARLCLAIVLFGSGTAIADEAPAPKPWYQQIAVNAFASVGYTWNFNNPSNNQNQLRAFDVNHNSITIDGAEVVVHKDAANPGEFGFRLDVAYGDVARVAAARGLFRDPLTGNSHEIDLQQAFASYIFPLGHGLRLDVGKFVTPAGAELIQGYDGYNDNFSRSLLFTLAIPFTHTGFKLTYPFNDKFAATVMLVNGWDNVIDNNSAKSFGVTFAITPNPKWIIYLNYIAGPEQDNNSTNFRHLADVVVVFKPTARWAFTLNADYGFDANAIGPPAPTMPVDPTVVAPVGPFSNAQWAGFAVYGRFQATARFAVILRGEAFWDIDGYRTGTPQRVLEGTLTPELKLTDAFLLRADLRADWSDQPVFIQSAGLLRRYQPTLGLNAIYIF
jgi:hypothetical protein